MDTCCGYAECLLRAGDPARALHISEEALARDRNDQLGLALWGTALRQLADEREAELNDYERFVRVYDLGAPEGFRDMAGFNAALNASLQEADIKDRLARLGIDPVGGTPQQFTAMAAADRAKWQKIIAERKITAE